MQKNAEGQCCEGFETASGLCTGSCVTKFRVCLKHYQARIDLSSSSVCTFGESFTPVLSNNIANFDVISFPLDFKWPVSFFSFFVVGRVISEIALNFIFISWKNSLCQLIHFGRKDNSLHKAFFICRVCLLRLKGMESLGAWLEDKLEAHVILVGFLLTGCVSSKVNLTVY